MTSRRPCFISSFCKPLIERGSRDAKIESYLTHGGLAQTSNFYYVVSKLLGVVLCHQLILPGKLCPDYRSQLNRQQRLLCHQLILPWKLCPDYRSQLNRQQRLGDPLQLTNQKSPIGDLIPASKKTLIYLKRSCGETQIFYAIMYVRQVITLLKHGSIILRLEMITKFFLQFLIASKKTRAAIIFGVKTILFKIDLKISNS
jgi:hypothetical protein